MKRVSVLVATCLSSVLFAQSGTLRSVEELPRLERSDVGQLWTWALAGFNGRSPYGSIAQPWEGARPYRVTYNSVDFDGKPTVLSGLVVFPLSRVARGMVVYMHGTSVGHDDCPSRGIKFGKGYEEAEAATAAFVSGGYVLAMPDMIGQGVSSAFHPFVMPSKNAPSGRDLAVATQELIQKVDGLCLPRLFVSGYSEGGANAMELAQLLEKEPISDMPLVASACMSGPYDLSGAQRESLLAPVPKRKDSLQYAIPFLTANLVRSAAHYYGDTGISVKGTFKWGFALVVPTALHGHLENFGSTELLGLFSIIQGYRPDKDGNYHLASIVKADVLKGLQDSDPNSPLYRVLKMYDTYDWWPKEPTYLVGLKQDSVVSYANTQNAARFMRQEYGVRPEIMNWFGIDNPNLSHITSVGGQLLLARRFFDGGFDAVPKVSAGYP